ncbi:MAG: glycosyltransferase family 1 protein [Lachnospiraceae bacterium]|nr:glycosyltransferase family 1 protein [Lachnospiraceae bacterium]
MRKARVLEVIGKRPVGGVGTVMLNYQNYIDAEKVQMDYLIFGEEAELFDDQVKALGSKVYMYPALSGRQMGRTKIYLEQFFAEHEGEYDIVHLHAPTIAFMAFPIIAKHGIKHRIIHSHATLYAENKVKAIRNKILWALAKGKITDRIGCSKAAGDFLFGNEDFIVLKNAIAYENYLYDEEVRASLRKDMQVEDKLVVGNVGRFSQQKNQIFLIEIFAKIKELHPDSVLWLLGDGELRNDIEAKIRTFGLQDSVKLFGMVKNTREYYQAMDVMVMPSLFEGLPMVGVEAQASGLPCVFADTITREVDVVGCPYISLQEPVEVWAKATIDMAGAKERRSYPEELDALGFNIKLEAKRLEEFYLEKIAGK